MNIHIHILTAHNNTLQICSTTALETTINDHNVHLTS